MTIKDTCSNFEVELWKSEVGIPSFHCTSLAQLYIRSYAQPVSCSLDLYLRTSRGESPYFPNLNPSSKLVGPLVRMRTRIHPVWV